MHFETTYQRASKTMNASLTGKRPCGDPKTRVIDRINKDAVGNCKAIV